MKRLAGPFLILVCTLIWGAAFVAQKTGAEHYAPFTLTCYRNVLAGLFLAAVICVRNAATGRGFSCPRREALGGSLSGLLLFLSMAAQQAGLETTTPGVSAFLTSNYILLVPFFAWAAGRGRPKGVVWLGVFLALGGTYLICAPASAGGGFGLGRGELLTLLCAVLFAMQIMVVDRFAPKCDVFVFSMVQLFAAGLFAAPFMLLPSEAARLTAEHFKAGWLSLFYVGILSSGIAYTLQNLGQARTPPSLAAVVMSFESVAGAVSGYLFLGDRLSSGQVAGCALVFSAIALASAWSDG